jgi:hypothetical protein
LVNDINYSKISKANLALYSQPTKESVQLILSVSLGPKVSTLINDCCCLPKYFKSHLITVNTVFTITFSISIVILIQKIYFLYFKNSFGQRSERGFEWICGTEKEKLEVWLQIKQGNDCYCTTSE